MTEITLLRGNLILISVFVNETSPKNAQISLLGKRKAVKTQSEG